MCPDYICPPYSSLLRISIANSENWTMSETLHNLSVGSWLVCSCLSVGEGFLVQLHIFLLPSKIQSLLIIILARLVPTRNATMSGGIPPTKMHGCWPDLGRRNFYQVIATDHDDGTQAAITNELFLMETFYFSELLNKPENSRKRASWLNLKHNDLHEFWVFL